MLETAPWMDDRTSIRATMKGKAKFSYFPGNKSEIEVAYSRENGGELRLACVLW